MSDNKSVTEKDAYTHPKLRIYLDNCCFNRPYDDQSQLRISLETQAMKPITKSRWMNWQRR